MFRMHRYEKFYGSLLPRELRIVDPQYKSEHHSSSQLKSGNKDKSHSTPNVNKNDSSNNNKHLNKSQTDHKKYDETTQVLSGANGYNISILQWNVLADGLSGSRYIAGNQITDVSKKASKYEFINVEKGCLQWKYRGYRIIEGLTQFMPDIICCQEIDKFSFLKYYLQPLGYVGKFKAKPYPATWQAAQDLQKRKYIDDPQLPPDGVAIFWRQDKFEILDFFPFGQDVYVTPTQNQINKGIFH